MTKNIILYLIIFVYPVLGLAYSDARRRDSLPSDSARHVVKITRTWTLPPVLQNISAFDFIDASRLACIQDVIGSIFIFNLQTDTIESVIPFGPPGDYEGLAIAGGSIFVGCADGRILEVTKFRSAAPVTKEYGTNLSVEQGIEGLCYDKKGNRLLVSIKGDGESLRHYKGIYAFDLATRTMAVKPVYNIDLRDTLLNKSETRRRQSVIVPSDIDIHPHSGFIYIPDAEKSQLLVLDGDGGAKFIFFFAPTEMIQPEGIKFTPSGELYVASGGADGLPGKILVVAYTAL